MAKKTQPQLLLESIIPRGTMKLGTPEAMRQEPSNVQWEEREARRDAWDEAEEHRKDLEWESRVSEEREASGYWDECPEEEG